MDKRSPNRLANLFSKHFNKKVKTIREEFDKDNTTAMKILNFLVEKPTIRLEFKPTNVYEVYKKIQKHANSKSSGSDRIMMSILKDCPQFAARIICHMFNNIILTNIYSEALKTSKMILIRNTGKDHTCINNYRPICILLTVDKVIQTILR